MTQSIALVRLPDTPDNMWGELLHLAYLNLVFKPRPPTRIIQLPGYTIMEDDVYGPRT